MVEDDHRRSPDPPSTMWCEVEAARDAFTPSGEQALGTLLRRYGPILLVHLRHRFGWSPEEAEDCYQSFIQEKFLKENLLASANRKRGRFRSYLLTTLDRFAVTLMRRQRRKGGIPDVDILSLETLSPEAAPYWIDAEEHTAEVSWSRAVQAGALLDMYAECVREHRDVLWGVFEQRLLRPKLGGEAAVAYVDLVREYKLRSPSQAFNLLNTAKRMFRRCLKQVIAQYLEKEEDIDEEIHHLKLRLKRVEEERPSCRPNPRPQKRNSTSRRAPASDRPAPDNPTAPGDGCRKV